MRRFGDVCFAVAWRNLNLFFSNPMFLLPSILFPLFFFVAFAGGLSSVGKVPGFDFPPGYTAFQFVFVLTQSSAFAGVFTGFTIATDFERGVARRMLLAAPNRLGILAGYAVGALVRASVIGVFITVVGLVFGMRINGSVLSLIELVVLMWGVTLVATLFAAGVALRTRTLQAAPLIQLPVFTLLFLAPVYVPLKLLTGVLKATASVNPFSAVLEAGRNLIAARSVDGALVISVLFALFVIFAVWSVRGLRKAEANSG